MKRAWIALSMLALAVAGCELMVDFDRTKIPVEGEAPVNSSSGAPAETDAGDDPDANDPDASEPDASDPDASDPDASDPDAGEPDASEEEDAGDPDAGDPQP